MEQTKHEWTFADVKTTIQDYHKKMDQKIKDLKGEFSNMIQHQNLYGKSNTMPCFKMQSNTIFRDEGFMEFIKTGLYQKSLSTSDESGGYLVAYPTQEFIAQSMMMLGSIRSHAKVSTISGDHLDVMVDRLQSDAGWVSEKEDRRETKTPTLKCQRIHAHEIYAKPMISQKLLDDAYLDVEAWIAEHIAHAMLRLENLSFVHGDGLGKPKGFLTYPKVPVGQGTFGAIECVKSGRDGGISSIDVFYQAIEAMKPEYLEGAIWYMSRSCLTQIRRLKSSDGMPLWQPSLIQGEPSLFLGFPVILSDEMPIVKEGNPSDSVVLSHFKRAYQIVDRQDLRLLRDPFTSKPFVEFYATKRVGGDVVDFDAIKIISLEA